MKRQPKNNGLGRPPTERGPYNPLPSRAIGRVSDDDWLAILRRYAEWLERQPVTARRSAKSFTRWATEKLKKT